MKKLNGLIQTKINK